MKQRNSWVPLDYISKKVSVRGMKPENGWICTSDASTTQWIRGFPTYLRALSPKNTHTSTNILPLIYFSSSTYHDFVIHTTPCSYMKLRMGFNHFLLLKNTPHRHLCTRKGIGMSSSPSLSKLEPLLDTSSPYHQSKALVQGSRRCLSEDEKSTLHLSILICHLPSNYLDFVENKDKHTNPLYGEATYSCDDTFAGMAGYVLWSTTENQIKRQNRRQPKRTVSLNENEG